MTHYQSHSYNLVRKDSYVEALNLDQHLTKIHVCTGETRGRGWVRVDDYADPTKCERPKAEYSNVWIMARYAGRPVGAQMSMCASHPTPLGWRVVDKGWDPNRCNRPQRPKINVKIIRRMY